MNNATVYENHKEEVINNLSYIQGYIEGLDASGGLTRAEDIIGRIQEAKAMIFEKLTDVENDYNE